MNCEINVKLIRRQV